MAKTVRFGIRGGVNLADMTARDVTAGTYSESQAKTAFNGGVFVNIPIGSKNFRLQPELSYSSQGGKMQGPSGSTTPPTYEQDLDYVNLPLNFQFMTNNGLFLQTGPQLGYLVGAERSSSSNAQIVPNGGNKENFDKFDFGWTGSVGYLSRMGLGVEARYNFGLTNIIQTDNVTTTTTLRNHWRTNAAQFSLIYHFGAGK